MDILEFLIRKLEQEQKLVLKEIQRYHGSLNWFGIVFRVTKQFLTSFCDAMSIAQKEVLFFPRRHNVLTRDLIFDCRYLKSFIKEDPKVSFDFLLGKLKKNDFRLQSDAATSWGWGGVLLFNTPRNGLNGLFCQQSWAQLANIFEIPDLLPQHAKSGVGELTGALFTRESFLDFCGDSLTIQESDNSGVVAWIEKGRVTKRPWDRMAQKLAMVCLARSAKFWARHIPRELNRPADLASKKPQGQYMRIDGLVFKRVRPKFSICLQLLRTATRRR